MKKIFSNIYQYLKKVFLKIFRVLEIVWVKRVSSILVFTYAIYLIYQNYQSIKAAITTLTINVPLAILLSFVILVTFLLSISAWRFTVLSFGFDFKWIDMAHVQMMSAIGKYIPGSIWNYSTKIFLSRKLGMPIETSGLAIVAEVIITYLAAICLSLFLVPAEVLPCLSGNTMIFLKVLGCILLVAALLTPVLIKRSSKLNELIKNPTYLYFALLLRIFIWIISGVGFNLLVTALGLPKIGLSLAMATITSSFFIGFLAFVLPDGFVVRETVIVFMLQNVLNSSDSILLSVIYRFLLISLEFLIIFIIFVLWKIREARLKNHVE